MKDYMAEWKKNSIRIGAPTCILAAFTAFIPVLYLCSRYDCWPETLEICVFHVQHWHWM